MSIVRLFLSWLLYTGILSASAHYVDNDLDGVDDMVDMCPHTPFDVLVDAQGCALKQHTLQGKLLIQASVNRNLDTTYKNTTQMSFFADYSYHDWDFSLATANYHTDNLTTIIDAEDDLFLTVGYTFHDSSTTTKIMAGTKFAFMQESNNSRNNDWFVAFDLNYQANEDIDLFSYYSYTISSNSTYTNYQNFHTLCIGAGYTVTPTWYSALSYNYISRYYDTGESYQSLSWLNTYMITPSLYLSLNYAYGLNDESYDHILSISIGAFFE